MRIRSAGALLLILIAGIGGAAAQQKGLYISGTNGLSAGIQPSPDFSYGNQGTGYFASRAKGDGAKIKFPEGMFGGMFDLPVANAPVTVPQIGLSGGGLSDTYVQPFTPGYHFSRIDFPVGYGFFAPTGGYTPGYRGNHISAGSTIDLTKNRRSTLSTFSMCPFHGKQRYTNITPGRSLDFEWGLGQMLPAWKNFLQVGAVGHGQWQTTASGGSVPTVVKNSRYGVAAIGPQAPFIAPKWNSNLFFRYESEFGASGPYRGQHRNLWWSHPFSSDQSICVPATKSRHGVSARYPARFPTALGSTQAPQRPERNARASTGPTGPGRLTPPDECT